MLLSGKLALLPLPAAWAMPPVQPYVRLAEIDVDPAQLDHFKAASQAHMALAMRNEPGLLALHAAVETTRPNRVRVFEMYESAEAYQAHLKTAHFKQFVESTANMITGRQLFDAVPLRAGGKPLLNGQSQVRVADLQIAPDKLDAYRAAVGEEIDASMRLEPGVRAIYSVALANDPGAMRFFEIYADESSYQAHIASPHFRKYVDTTKEMITSRELHLTVPIALQMKSTPDSP